MRAALRGRCAHRSRPCHKSRHSRDPPCGSSRTAVCFPITLFRSAQPKPSRWWESFLLLRHAQVFVDQRDPLPDASGAVYGVRRRVQDIVEEPVHGGRRDIGARVGRAVINEYLIATAHPAAGERYIGDIAYAFLGSGPQEIAARFGDHFVRSLQVAKETIENVTQAGRGVAHTMGEVQPTLLRLQRRGANTVLDLVNSVVLATVEDHLFRDYGMLHVGRQPPSDAAALARVDKTVLRPRVKRVLAIDELGVENAIALLGGGCPQVVESLPDRQVVSARDAALRDRRGEVAGRRGGIFAFGAEQAVDPPVL